MSWQTITINFLRQIIDVNSVRACALFADHKYFDCDETKDENGGDGCQAANICVLACTTADESYLWP